MSQRLLRGSWPGRRGRIVTVHSHGKAAFTLGLERRHVSSPGPCFLGIGGLTPQRQSVIERGPRMPGYHRTLSLECQYFEKTILVY